MYGRPRLDPLSSDVFRLSLNRLEPLKMKLRFSIFSALALTLLFGYVNRREVLAC
jgi:hypothetical protein